MKFSKRRAVLVVFLAVTFVIASFERASGREPDGAHRASSNLSANSVIYGSVEPMTVRFAKPVVSKDPINRTYDWLDIEGCDSRISQLGHPALPAKTITFKLNLGLTVTNVDVTIVNASFEGVYRICPALKPIVGESGGGLTTPDPAIYGSDRLYPEKWSKYVIRIGIDPDSDQRVQYVAVTLYPVQYAPTLGSLTICKEATVRVRYEGVARASAASTYNLLIITSPTLQPWASDLASYRTSMGIATETRTTDWIYANYAGVDNPEKIRNFVIWAKNNWGIQYLLIFGDADQVPVRYAFIPDGEGGDDDTVETDLYYADLQYSWDENADRKWGELRLIGGDSVDGFPDLYLGRLPASTTTEASNLVNKIKQYEQNTSPSSYWFKSFLLLGTDLFKQYAGAEGEIIKDYVASNYLPGGFISTKLYETAGTLTVPNAVARINAGFGFVNFAGHGNPTVWSFEGAGVYSSSDASSQTNGFRLPLICTMACQTSRFADRECIGEQFLLNPYGGAIGYFGAARNAHGFVGSAMTSGLAGEVDWRFFQAYYAGYRRLGQIWAWAISQYEASHSIHDWWDFQGYYLDWKTVAEYSSPFGDPTLMIGGGFKSITVASYPSGSGFVKVDGVAIATPYTFTWTVGSTHTLEALSPVSAGSGIQYAWVSWSDGGSRTHLYTTPSSSQTVTANYKTQYYLTMQANPSGAGSVSPASGWYDAGSSMAIQATPSSGWGFLGWTGTGSGSYSGRADPASIILNGPITETANFQQRPWASIVSPSGWLRGTVTLTATAGDIDGYVVRVRFIWTPDKTNGPFYVIGDDTNGADGWSISWDCGGPNNNDVSVWVAAVALDNSGLDSDWSWSNQFGVDHTAPSTPSVSETHCGSVWTAHDSPRFTWSDPGDSGSGVSYYEGSIDGESPFTVSSGFHPTWGDGTHTFKVRAVDRAGNRGSWSNTITVKIDTQPPTAPALSSPTDRTTTTNNRPTFQWNPASDGTSGVASYTFQIDTSTGFNSGNLRTITGITSISYTPSSSLMDGTWYWRVKAVDNAGNEGSFSSYWSLIVDTTLPTGSILINGGATYTTSTSATLTLSASDANGVVQMRFSNGGSSWSAWEYFSTSKSWTLTSGDGTKTVYVKYKDNAGLESSSFSDTIVLDASPPSTVTLLSPSNRASTFNTQPAFQWNPATDAGSGIASYTFQIDFSTAFNSGNLRTVTGITSTSYTPPTPLAYGTWYWRVKAIDNLGNEGSFSPYWILYVGTVTTITRFTTTSTTTAATTTTYSTREVLTSQTLTTTSTGTIPGTSYQITSSTKYSGSVSTTYTSRTTLHLTSTSFSTTTTTLTSAEAYTSFTTQRSKTGTMTIITTHTSYGTSGITAYEDVVVQRRFVEQFLERITCTINRWIGALVKIIQSLFVTETTRDTVVKVEPRSAEPGHCRFVLNASPRPGYVNKPVTISGTMYGSWRCITDGMVVGKPIEITTSWGFRADVTTGDDGRFSIPTSCPSVAGTYTIAATFSEDEDLTGASTTIQYEVVSKIPTVITVQIISIFQGYGVPPVYSVAGYLKTKEGGLPIAGKTIYVTVRTAMGETRSYECTTDANGYYRIPDMFTDRPTPATAEFKGDADYEPSTASTG